jgi:Uma2 family endonuclease
MSVSVGGSARYCLAPLPVRRFAVEEYHRLINENFFRSDERFELLDGYITPKMSHNPPNDAAVNRARRRIERALPAEWIVRVQSAITTADSEPEPDIAVVRGDDDDYVSHHPGPADLALVVEVANTTLASDRGPKLMAYARAGILAYWIINLDEAQLEVFTTPDIAAASFAPPRILKGSDTVTIAMDGALSQTILVADLLP